MTPGVDRTRAPMDAAVVRPLILLMGVAGSGKSLIGSRLAEALGSEFVDADSLHSPRNIARMRSGLPLREADRVPWLAACAAVLAGWRRDARVGVLACSALKSAYRRRIVSGDADVVLVHLAISREAATQRLRNRVGHFMPASLIDSQFTDLEIASPDESALVLDALQPPDTIVSEIGREVTARFGLSAAPGRAFLASARPIIEGERP